MCIIDKCEFCSLETAKYPVLPKHLQDLDVSAMYQNLIYNGNFFYVKPDISPVVARHLLIIPKEHIFCMAELSESAKEEIMYIKDKIKQFYRQTGMTCLLFEHGCCEDRQPGSSCIHHAHLHTIPIREEEEKKLLLTTLRELGTNFIKKENTKGVPYLFLETENFDGRYWVDNIKRSQFFRILIAETIGEAQRSRWQNCLVNPEEREKSRKWLELCRGVHF